MPKFQFQCCDCCHEFQRDLQLYELYNDQACPECESTNTKAKKSGYGACGNGGVTPCGRIDSSGCGGGCGI